MLLLKGSELLVLQLLDHQVHLVLVLLVLQGSVVVVSEVASVVDPDSKALQPLREMFNGVLVVGLLNQLSLHLAKTVQMKTAKMIAMPMERRAEMLLERQMADFTKKRVRINCSSLWMNYTKLNVVDTGEQGEETVFSNQGKLFFFDGKAWGERGFGIFKFNVTQKSEDDRSGRFIMRVHQTYRVILNTPVFKQMSIGDSKGKEPPGKAISFAVVENGKPVPYMLRVRIQTTRSLPALHLLIRIVFRWARKKTQSHYSARCAIFKTHYERSYSNACTGVFVGFSGAVLFVWSGFTK